MPAPGPLFSPQTLRLFDVVCIIVLLSFLALGLTGFDMVQENGLIENIQVLVMLLGAGLLIAQIAYLVRPSFAQADKATITYCLFALCMPLIGAGRELSFGRVVGASPGLVTALKYSMGVVILTILITCLVLWVFHVRRRFAHMRILMLSDSSMSIYIGLFLFGLATVAEKAHVGPTNGMFLEELLELATFMMIVRASLQVRPVSKEPSSAAPQALT